MKYLCPRAKRGGMEVKMNKVLLVDLFISDDISFSIGTLELATILIKNKIKCQIINVNELYHNKVININENIEIELAKYLLSLEFDIVGFSCMCNNYHIFLKLAEIIKEKNKNIKIFLGGPQATLTAMDTMKYSPNIDLICLGESETYIVDVIKYLRNETMKIPNSCMLRHLDKIVQSTELEYMEKLDNLPFLDYSLIPFFKDVEVINIETGRGCPFSCSFCSTKTFWKQKVRYKKIDRIVKEIKILRDKYNKRKFNFIHDLFTSRRDFIISFCKFLIDEKINISWSCSSRLDTIDYDILELMRAAGCYKIFFGIESGSNEIQKRINKNLNLGKLPLLIHQLKKLDYSNCSFSFIYDFPFETESEFKETCDIIEYLLLNTNYIVMLSKCTILPGTALFSEYFDELEYCKESTTITSNYDLNTYEPMINRNKQIFSYYYSINTPFHSKYNFFENFFTFVSSAHNLFNKTFNILLNEYNGLMNMYDSLPKNVYKCINQIHYFDSPIYQSKNSFHQMLNNILIVLETLIKLINEENQRFLFDILDFEKVLITIEEGDEIIRTYGNNVANFKFQNKNKSFCMNNPQTLLITKLNNKKRIKIIK